MVTENLVAAHTSQSYACTLWGLLLFFTSITVYALPIVCSE
jgi:hypothetical protein